MVIASSNLTAQTQNSNQRKRVRQGVKSGELTKAETAVLAHQQKDIRTAKHQARADGKVNRDEEKILIRISARPVKALTARSITRETDINIPIVYLYKIKQAP